MGYQNFDALISSLHDGNQILDAEKETPIIINKFRQFEIPVDYNTIIAYEGDINSQIVTFACPVFSDGHDLSKCQNKKIRWQNAGSGIDGNSNLIYEETTIIGEEQKQLLKWEVPPEAFTKSGELQISIVLFDQVDGKIAFSWNTAPFFGLSVGATLDSVGDYIYGDQDVYIPPKNEILSINTDTRTIIAPPGYNNIVCNYGDVGTSTVYFQAKRYFKGMDLLSNDVEIVVRWNVNGQSGSMGGNTVNLYTIEFEDRKKEGLVDIIWHLPDVITKNHQYYVGNFSIQIQFRSIGKIWNSNTYNNLIIGESTFMATSTDMPDFPIEPDSGQEGQYIINGNGYRGDKIDLEVAGIISFRDFRSNESILLSQNELGIEYDNESNYVGIKIGTKPGGQPTYEAPYIAFADDQLVIFDGGNASGNI